MKKILKEVEEYDEFSKKKKNRLLLLKQEPIYIGFIASLMVVILLSIFEVLQIFLENTFGIRGYSFIIIKIVVLLFLLSLYTNYVQFLRYRKKNKPTIKDEPIKKEIKKGNKLVTYLYILVILLLLSYLFYVFFSNAYITIKCDYDKDILHNESEGQLILNQLVEELKENLMVLERNNPNFSIRDKINFTNYLVYSHVADFDDTYVNASKCYKQYMTMENPVWGKSFNCLRRSYPKPNFTIIQGCGRCGEVANLNKYLLENIGIKTRVVGIPRGDHAWNEVYIDGKWIDTDATDPNNFIFNDTSYYKDVKKLDVFWVKVEEGEGKGEDVTQKYNPHLSLKNKLSKFKYKFWIYIDGVFKKSIKKILVC